MSRKLALKSPLRPPPLSSKRPGWVSRLVAAGSILAVLLVLTELSGSKVDGQQRLLGSEQPQRAAAALTVGPQEAAAIEQYESQKQQLLEMQARVGLGQLREQQPQQQQLELAIGWAKENEAQQQQVDPAAQQRQEQQQEEEAGELVVERQKHAAQQPREGQVKPAAQAHAAIEAAPSLQQQADARQQAQQQADARQQAQQQELPASSSAQADGIAQGGLAQQAQQGESAQQQQQRQPQEQDSSQDQPDHTAPMQQQQQVQQAQQAQPDVKAQTQHAQQAQQMQHATAEQGQPSAAGAWPTVGDTIHVLVTSSGNSYQSWQMRIMYATFKLVQKMPGGEKMVAFTRILHRGRPDLLTDEVPTYRVDPHTPACDEGWAGCEYPPRDRPNAVRTFMEAAQRDPSLIKAPWLYMVEPDYVWMHPVKALPAEDPSVKAQFFPFNYMAPAHPGNAAAMRKLYPESAGPLTDIPPTGPAPGLMRAGDWLKVAPLWDDTMQRLEADQEAVRTIGWVREMYAFAVACALARIPTELTPPPASQLMAQPPADPFLGNASALHYTWGTILRDASNKELWRFDKRDYSSKEFETHVPTLPALPPYREGMNLGTLNPGFPVLEEGLYTTLAAMVKQINLAAATLPDLPTSTAAEGEAGGVEAGAGASPSAAKLERGATAEQLNRV